MVFSNLRSHEKDAFFSLLDEYFSSRPEIFSGSPDAPEQAGPVSSSRSAAASAVQRAFASNPEATSKLVSAGLRHGVPKSSPYSAAASDPEVGNAVGRVAAASMAFHSNANNPPPFRRTPSNTSPPPIAEKPAAPGLVTSRAFGEVDMSSPKNLFGSLRSSSANKNAVHSPPVVPPAFAAKKNAFAPPPTRHEPPAPPPREPTPEAEEETHGEWAEALYDYDSKDPGDLQIREGQNVLVTERTSADWWTGEFQGKTGLFPASYVKIL